MAAEKKDNGSKRPEETGAAPGGDGGRQPRVRFDDSQMRSGYANVANVSSTREEVVLMFGVNQSWQGGPEVTVQLTDRIILSPYAAKRLLVVLQKVMEQYEQRFGALEPATPSPGANA